MRKPASARHAGTTANSGARTTRRDAILDAAAALFCEKGFANTTTLDIVTAAEVSKRDLYAGFASKEALLEAIIQRGVEAMVAPLALEPAADRASFYRSLETFGHTFLGLLLSPNVLGLYRMAIAETPSSAAIGRALLSGGAGKTTALVSGFVADAIRAGHVRFQHEELAVGAFFCNLIGDLQMRALLDPAAGVAPDAINRHVALAIATVQRLEIDLAPISGRPVKGRVRGRNSR